jgi:hypothetical protein
MDLQAIIIDWCTQARVCGHEGKQAYMCICTSTCCTTPSAYRKVHGPAARCRTNARFPHITATEDVGCVQSSRANSVVRRRFGSDARTRRNQRLCQPTEAEQTRCSQSANQFVAAEKYAFPFNLPPPFAAESSAYAYACLYVLHA